MGKKFKITAWLLMLVLAMVTAFPVRTLAYERINTSAKCSMELSFMREDQPVDGCRVRAYRICEVTDYGKYLFMPAFQDYKVETYGFDQKACAIGVRARGEDTTSPYYEFAHRAKNDWVRIGAKDFMRYLSKASGIDFLSKSKQFIAEFDPETETLIIVVDEEHQK